ncbi:hypothetical protein [Desulfurispirillum indicum]|uniref:MFS superfamily di/tripeptide transporter n=1 Tax=Desulfurispirillum indicum (strain ATCC BAA-1389 / DSM 22839 / S5) TaxID=653733 RepID=E6W180_DESIS|nr:hypothetical protein [Desulfurispirillum indicum]ADU66500.1 MFS superfamily di/tripeptide transporter [Desulfurispirillum indicum S5]
MASDHHDEIQEEPLKPEDIAPLTMGFIGTIVFAVVTYLLVISFG